MLQHQDVQQFLNNIKALHSVQ